jgi:hypothetical protein
MKMKEAVVVRLLIYYRSMTVGVEEDLEEEVLVVA